MAKLPKPHWRWSFAEQFAQHAISLLSFFVVARLIGPSSYGLFGVAYAPVALLQSVLMRGVADHLFSSEQGSKDEAIVASTLFWLTTGIGGAFCLLLIGAAYNLRINEQVSEIRPMIGVLSILCLFSGLAAVPIALLERSLNFRPLALRTLIGGIVGATVSIIMALRGAGPWSLVFQLVVQQLVSVLIIFGAAAWRPSFQVRTNLLSRVFKRIGTTISSNAITSAELFVPRVIVAHFAGVEASGFVTASQRIYQLLLQLFTYPVARVSFVAWSKEGIHEDSIAMSFARTNFVVAAILTPIMIASSFLSPLFIPLLLGEAWRGAGEVVAIMLWGLLPAGGFLLIQTLSRGMNRQHSMLPGHALQAVGILAAFQIAGPFGLAYALAGGVFIAYAGWLGQLAYVKKWAGYQALYSIKPFWRIALPGAAMALVMYAQAHFASGLLGSILGALCGVAVYVTGTLILRKGLFGFQLPRRSVLK